MHVKHISDTQILSTNIQSGGKKRGLHFFLLFFSEHAGEKLLTLPLIQRGREVWGEGCSSVTVAGFKQQTSRRFKRGVRYAKGRERLCHTAGPPRGSLPLPGPAAVLWETSRTHQRAAPGSRLRGQTDVNTA